MGDVADFRNIHGGGDRPAGVRPGYGIISRPPSGTDARVMFGGQAATDDSVGYFVQPTLVQVEDPTYR